MSNSAGTLISDLDGAAGGAGSDNDIVAQIMADMNGGGHAPAQQQQMQVQQQLPPPIPVSSHMINAGPGPNTMLQNTIDPNVAAAHIIGNRQPSPADFTSMMSGLGTSMGGPGTGFPQGAGAGGYMPQYDMQPFQQKSGSQWLDGTNSWLRELKTPILVAIIFCIMSLPVVNVMIGHYFPRLLRIGGDLTMIGLGVKSLMAGGLFFVIQRVLVPLVTN
jgi:hypothetical protein